MDAFIPDLDSASPHSAQGSGLHETIDQVARGYPFTIFEALAQDLGLTQRELAAVLGISGGTLTRRRGGRLSTAESSRVYEVQRLLEQAEQTIGHPDDARRWLKEPNRTLGDAPLTLARTAPGLEAVQRYLGQIAEGVVL